MNLRQWKCQLTTRHDLGTVEPHAGAAHFTFTCSCGMMMDQNDSRLPFWIKEYRTVRARMMETLEILERHEEKYRPTGSSRSS